MIITVVEIALLIMLPLVLFYRHSAWGFKTYLPSIGLIYIIWYFTYAPLHELSHMLGALSFNKTIFDYKLIPKFWIGEFGTAFINYDYKSDGKDFIIILLPYLRDMIFLIVGYFLIGKISSTKPLLIGLVLVIFVLSPMFDIGNNYFAYILGSMNDFNALSESSSNLISNLIGISFFSISLLSTFMIIRKLKNYPKFKTE